MRTTSLLSVLTVFSAGLLAAPLTASGASAASDASAVEAAPSCSVRIPARIAVGSPYQAVKVTLAPDCAAAGVIDAYWTAYHPTAGGTAFAAFEAKARTGVVDVYDFDPLGHWSWRPSGAFGKDFKPVKQNYLASVVKVSSWSRLTATRAGRKVTLTAAAARYAASLDRFVPWAGASGQLQYKAPGATRWIPLKSVKTTAGGRYTYSYLMATTRDYRVYFPATGLIWNIASPTVRK
ncbi:hypothetical protein OG394_27610 [Kribbella sp. NBC_01245]|uniref:hypothetical protein n=1 Tax=Kribbella sp. NBC_01245 TaxID=2903578 RepID=UPI002E2A82B8|nr:hypothetical protein [Kribbella sp. NBC_01245]